MLIKQGCRLTPSPKQPITFYNWGILLLLLCGVFFRCASLTPMNTMLHYDEAWNGADAAALIEHPRLIPFLTNNFGRESGWVYWITPYIIALGASPFAVHLAAAVTGILTLAAACRLGRELFGSAGAFWGLAVLSIFYWHVHLSHLALRANLYILIGTLAAAWLLRAWRTNTRRAWITGGLWLGLLAYTYFASAAWIIYTSLLVLGVAFFDRRRRPGAILALVCALIIIIPIGSYFCTHPIQFLDRPATVSSMTRDGITHNLQCWAAAWFSQGDLNAEFNLPGRPILDPITGFLGALGLVGLGFFSRHRGYALLFIGWGIAAWLPSLFSNFAPHFLRASGMTVAIALLVGVGGQLLARLSLQFFKKPLAVLLPLLLLIPVGQATFVDFNRKWIHHPETFAFMEQHINHSITYVHEHVAPDDYVYFSPFNLGHPAIIFRKADLAPRPVGAFDSHQCLVLPNHHAVYASLTMYEPDFQRNLAQWADVIPLYEDPVSPVVQPRYTIFAADPNPNLFKNSVQSTVRFGDLLNIHLLSPLSTTVKPGDTLPIVLGIRPLKTPNISPSIFVHLYGIPTPNEGGPLWAQADSQICASYPAHLWRTEEIIIQTFTLYIPPGITPGLYTIAIGVYPFPSGERLPITAPSNTPPDYFILHEMTIVVPTS